MPKSFVNHLQHDVTHLTLNQPSGRSTWTPNTDVYECDDGIVVKMELAGVAPNDLEITLHNRLLVVCGCRQDNCRRPQQRCSFRQMEIDYGFFERRIVISQPVDHQRAEARLANGFLQITLPKTTESVHSTVTILVEQLT